MDDPKRLSVTKADCNAPLAFNQQQTADYIAEMAQELSRLAGEAELRFLRYLIDMVTDEAMRKRDRHRRRRTDKQ